MIKQMFEHLQILIEKFYNAVELMHLSWLSQSRIFFCDNHKMGITKVGESDNDYILEHWDY
jgi:hypothetical protein